MPADLRPKVPSVPEEVIADATSLLVTAGKLLRSHRKGIGRHCINSTHQTAAPVDGLIARFHRLASRGASFAEAIHRCGELLCRSESQWRRVRRIPRVRRVFRSGGSRGPRDRLDPEEFGLGRSAGAVGATSMRFRLPVYQRPSGSHRGGWGSKRVCPTGGSGFVAARGCPATRPGWRPSMLLGLRWHCRPDVEAS